MKASALSSQGLSSPSLLQCFVVMFPHAAPSEEKRLLDRGKSILVGALLWRVVLPWDTSGVSPQKTGDPPVPGWPEGSRRAGFGLKQWLALHRACLLPTEDRCAVTSCSPAIYALRL